MGFFDFMTEDIAIDLGTANTLIIHNGKVVIDSPSIVARNRVTGRIIATGKEANLMQGKTHENIKTIRPLKDGVIADFQASEEMIKEFVKKIPAIKKKLFPPALRMVICIPSGITEVEKRAVQDSARHMNAKEIYLIYEPMVQKELQEEKDLEKAEHLQEVITEQNLVQVILERLVLKEVRCHFKDVCLNLVSQT